MTPEQLCFISCTDHNTFDYYYFVLNNILKHIFLFLAFLCPHLVSAQTTWQPLSYIVTVKIKNVDVAITEKFTGFKTDFTFSPDKLESSHIKATIRVNTTITSQTEHLTDSENFTIVYFESTSLYIKGSRYAGMFNITVNGETKHVEIPFDYTSTDDEAVFKSTFNINSANFGEGIKALTMNKSANVSIYIKAKS